MQIFRLRLVLSVARLLGVPVSLDQSFFAYGMKAKSIDSYLSGPKYTAPV